MSSKKPKSTSMEFLQFLSQPFPGNTPLLVSRVITSRAAPSFSHRFHYNFAKIY